MAKKSILDILRGRRQPTITPVRPVYPYIPTEEQDEEDRPFSIWEFVWNLFLIALLWLIIKPVVDEFITTIFPSLVGITNGWIILWKSVPWIITVGLIWRSIRRLLKD